MLHALCIDEHPPNEGSQESQTRQTRETNEAIHHTLIGPHNRKIEEEQRLEKVTQSMNKVEKRGCMSKLKLICVNTYECHLERKAIGSKEP